MLTLTSPHDALPTARGREVVRLWLLGADAPSMAYAPGVDAYTLTSGKRGNRPGGEGLATLSISGTWSPEYPRAAGGQSVAAATYPWRDLDTLEAWLSEGDRRIRVAWRRRDGSEVIIGTGVLSGGGIDLVDAAQGETRVLQWSIAINMDSGSRALWQGERPAPPAPEAPDGEDETAALAWDATPTTFEYSSGGNVSITLPGATGGTSPYIFSGVPPNAAWSISGRELTKPSRLIQVATLTFDWTVTDAAGASLTQTITLMPA